MLLILLLVSYFLSIVSFTVKHSSRLSTYNFLQSNKDSKEVYSNQITSILGNFIGGKNINERNSLDSIDWNAKKVKGLSISAMAKRLDILLRKDGWFVTGNVDPTLFSDDFMFQDPDVKLTGIEQYARGVNKLFDQKISKCSIISTIVNNTLPNTITITWRLEGAVKIGPGLRIKPYIVYTDLRVSPKTGLIEFQQDRFSIPGWDILLSAISPFPLPFLAPPAPEVVESQLTPRPFSEGRRNKSSWFR